MHVRLLMPCVKQIPVSMESMDRENGFGSLGSCLLASLEYSPYSDTNAHESTDTGQQILMTKLDRCIHDVEPLATEASWDLRCLQQRHCAVTMGL